MKKSVRTSVPVKIPMKPLPGRSLMEKFPALAQEWDYEKNFPLTPKDVSYGTTYKLHWICASGHHYEMGANNRTSEHGQQGCPYCSCGGNRIWDGNCLSTICPEIADEWHPIKNKTLTPRDVTYASPQIVWWKCKKGHEWESSVYTRTLSRFKNKNHGSCPYCAGKRACNDNCLATVLPRLVKEWHPTKNGNLTPYSVTAYSGKNAWWQCAKGHVWNATICHRSLEGTACPHCSKIILKDGTEHDSATEAYFYLKFKAQGKHIVRHGNYNGLGNFKFDFYFPEENKYVEITGFGARYPRVWKTYMKNIRKKRAYVKNILGAKFSFRCKKLTAKEMLYVRSNML